VEIDDSLFLKKMGQRIVARRKKLGLTQEALAEKGDVSPQTISYVETGSRAMRLENLLKLASALEVSTDYLLTGEIIDKDLLLMSEKLQKLKPQLFRSVESIVDECITLAESKTD
jgi:transcriptional regulator with XRE-family HTH domain